MIDVVFAAIISLASIAACGLGLIAIFLILRSVNRKQIDDGLMLDVDRAVERKDVNELRRLRFFHSSSLSKIDEGLPQRIDELADDLYIQQDDETKYTETKR